MAIMENGQLAEDDALLEKAVKSISERVGGQLNEAAMNALSTDEITLWGYWILREEVLDGGFVQLIYNGYGPFFFANPFAKVVRLWGLVNLSKLVYRAKDLYKAHGREIAQERSDEEFMALYEAFPAFDDLDDEFVMNEEGYTADIAEYVRKNMASLVDE